MTEPVYLTSFKVTNEPPFGDLELALPDPSKLHHIIFTGKNGTGKSRLLIRLSNDLKGYFDNRKNIIRIRKQIKTDQEWTEQPNLDQNTQTFQNIIESIVQSQNMIEHLNRAHLRINITEHKLFELVEKSNFFFSYLPAKRFDGFKKPSYLVTGPELEMLTRSNKPDELLTYIQSRFMQVSVASYTNELTDKDESESWFKSFNKILQTLTGDKELTVFVEPKSLKVSLKSGSEIFSFSDLSDGFLSYLKIVTSVIWSMGLISETSFSKPGIVFIDEIENHLHVSLQKTILPHLIELFPNVQFIVATHSPFVLSSVPNAVVYDLGTKQFLENLSRYSYDTLIEGYFGIDSYSSSLKDRVRELETKIKELPETADISQVEATLSEIRKEINSLPHFILNPDGIVTGNELLQKLYILESKLLRYV